MIIIKIPFKTPTINHLYGRAGIRSYLKPAAKKMRDEIGFIIGKLGLHYPEELMGKNLKVRVEVYEDWYTKKNTVKRKDVANREKFLIDSVMDAIGIDDKFIFEHHMVKCQDEDEEYSLISIDVVESLSLLSKLKRLLG